MNIGPTGIWQCENTEPHSFDSPLCCAIIELFKQNEVMTVVDMGCGSGQYVAALNDDDFVATGFDGNPNTWKFNADCHTADLSKPLACGDFDAVLSLETGEHIPREFESVFLDNICNPARKMVVLSWFPRPGEGIGHVNERPNFWVVQEIQKRGFMERVDWSQKLRESATMWWFKESLMAFKKPQ